MKTITRLAMLAAVAAGFASCSIREMAAPEAPANRVSITVNAGLEQTKTVFGAPENGVIPVTWASEGEQLVLFEIADGVSSQSDTAEVYTLENGGANAKFQFAFAAGSAASYDYFALYPASARRTVKAGNYGVNNQVTDFAWPDAFQKSTADGPDPNHCLFLSTLKGQTAQPTELNMKFQHLCGYGKVSIKDLKLVNGEKAESLTLTFENDTVVGRYGLMPDGSMKLEAGAAKAIKIDLATIAPEGGNFAAWFAAKPFTFNAGDKATVVVSTNKRAFTKEITATADLSFEAGSATAFTVDMSTADAPEALGGDKELVFDFSTATATLPSWPTAAANVDGEYVYPLDGVDYSFYLYKTCAAAAQITVYNAGSAVGLPVIQGHKLVAVICSSAKGKTSYKGSISSDKGGTQVVKGGETQNWTAVGNYTYKLEETAADTRYWIYGVGPLPVKKITLYYDKVGETPAGPQPYEYPEVKGIEPLTCFYWGETYGTATSKPMTGALNYKKLDDGSGIEFIEESHNYAVPGATLSVPGCTFFEVCSAGANKMYDVYALIKGNTPEAPLPLYYSIPVKSAISGDLEFCCSINQANNLLSKITFAWSTDKTNWKDFDAVYSKTNCSPEAAAGKTGFEATSNNAANNWAVCCFSIPEAEAIPAGGTFYVRATPEFASTMDATKTIRANGGFMLLSKVVNTDFSASSNVLASRNFGDFWSGFQGMIGKPTRYFVSSYGNGAEIKIEPNVADAYGWTPCGTFVQRRGYVWAQDNAEVAAYYQSPALTALTEPTDVMVTFKCCVFVDPLENVHPDNFGVSVEGPGEVQELQKDSPAVPEGATHLSPEAYQWHRYYALIKGATAETKVNVGKLSAVSASRFYLDDIVVTK